MFGRTKKPPLMLRVTLTDGKIFEAEASERSNASLFLGTDFVRVKLDGDAEVLYPMHRVKEMLYHRPLIRAGKGVLS